MRVGSFGCCEDPDGVEAISDEGYEVNSDNDGFETMGDNFSDAFDGIAAKDDEDVDDESAEASIMTPTRPPLIGSLMLFVDML
jgi:hypothetical protein